MKRLICVTGCFVGLALAAAHGADSPRGTLLELHSCELYAGGCVVSAEAPQGGRYMLRVWDFSDGSFHGVNLHGLQLAVLQVSQDNLAMTDAASGDAVVYLPASATEPQRAALLDWLKSDQPDFHPTHLQTRVVPLQFSRAGDHCTFSAGTYIDLNSTPMSCETTACGEALWYQPRTATSIFTVAVDRTSRISEPSLKLKWTDSGKRSVFLARFGEPTPSKNVYVTMAEFCGSKL